MCIHNLEQEVNSKSAQVEDSLASYITMLAHNKYFVVSKVEEMFDDETGTGQDASANECVSSDNKLVVDSK